MITPIYVPILLAIMSFVITTWFCIKNQESNITGQPQSALTGTIAAACAVMFLMFGAGVCFLSPTAGLDAKRSTFLYGLALSIMLVNMIIAWGIFFWRTFSTTKKKEEAIAHYFFGNKLFTFSGTLTMMFVGLGTIMWWIVGMPFVGAFWQSIFGKGSIIAILIGAVFILAPFFIFPYSLKGIKRFIIWRWEKRETH